MTAPRSVLAADDVVALGYPAAVVALEGALRDGLDPATDPPRVVVDLPAGQFLLMPAASASAAGVKVVTLAPDNPARGLPRIQADYLLYDAGTLSLTAILDGTALTALRTPAVSVAAAAPALRRYRGPVDAVVFGAGPQGRGHVAALRDCSVVELGAVTHVVRNVATAAPDGDAVIGSDDPRVGELLRRARIVVCATSARIPLFDSTLLADDVTVIAVGSHEPDAREVDTALVRRAQVVVEDQAAAMREAGDVVLAVAAGALEPGDVVTMADLVRGDRDLDPARPVLVKTVGMAWQDLVVAEAVLRARENVNVARR